MKDTVIIFSNVLLAIDNEGSWSNDYSFSETWEPHVGLGFQEAFSSDSLLFVILFSLVVYRVFEIGFWYPGRLVSHRGQFADMFLQRDDSML